MLNYAGLSSLTPREVAGSAARVLRFFDLAGHERFSKTLLCGLTALLPDYVLLCVSAAAAGVSWVTREHLAVALALGIPVFVAVTTADLAPAGAVQQVADEMRWVGACTAVAQRPAAALLPAGWLADWPSFQPCCGLNRPVLPITAPA